jgi:excisionase family DNA binding protein
MGIELELRVMLRDVVREVVREELGARPSTELEAELLTYAQAGALVSVGRTTIKRWVRSGALVALGKGRLRRVRAADVRACLQARERPPAPAVPELKQNVHSILASLPRSRGGR